MHKIDVNRSDDAIGCLFLNLQRGLSFYSKIYANALCTAYQILRMTKCSER